MLITFNNLFKLLQKKIKYDYCYKVLTIFILIFLILKNHNLFFQKNEKMHHN